MNSDVLTLAEFRKNIAGGCQVPNCEHKHEAIVLHARCHIRSGTFVSVDPKTMVLRIICATCKKPIVAVQLADAPDAPVIQP